MSSAVDPWDECDVDSSQLEALLAIKRMTSCEVQVGDESSSSSKKIDSGSSGIGSGNDESNAAIRSDEVNDKHAKGLYTSLSSGQHHCSHLLEEVGSVLDSLRSLAADHDEVTGRSNDLMRRCEELLEQETSLYETVAALKAALTPLWRVEEQCAGALGIPMDARGNRQQHHQQAGAAAALNDASSGTTVVDPRSAEFREIVQHLTDAVAFLHKHTSSNGSSSASASATFLDSAVYLRYLVLLHNRASSVLTKAMKEMLANAADMCREQYIAGNRTSGGGGGGKGGSAAGGKGSSGSSSSGRGNIVSDYVLESSPIYNKFRGLGYRMRELSVLLNKFNGNITRLVELGGGAGHGNGSGSGSGGSSGGLVTTMPPGLRRSNSSSNNFLAAGGSPRANTNTNTGTGAPPPGGALVLLLPSDLLGDIHDYYMELRLELLRPILHDMLHSNSSSGNGSNASAAAAGSGTGNSGAMSSSLCYDVRYLFTTLLRITVLEQQLFNTLFVGPSVASAAATEGVASPTTVLAVSNPSLAPAPGSTVAEASRIVEQLCRYVEQHVRPRIIREHSIEELCHISSVLQHDLHSQVLNTMDMIATAGTNTGSSGAHVDVLSTPRRIATAAAAPPTPSTALATATQLGPMRTALLGSIHRIVSETQERLLFCVDAEVRSQLQRFEPVFNEHLNYPDLLLKHQQQQEQEEEKERKAAGAGGGAAKAGNGKSSSSGTVAMADIVHSWYPTLRTSLSLLSKLYGIVDREVFADISRRAVALTVQSLRIAAEKIKKQAAVKITVGSTAPQTLSTSSLLHGDLFLIRHLLILREQLVAFDISDGGWGSVEKRMDFSSTSAAFAALIGGGGVKANGEGGAGVGAGGSGVGSSSLWRLDAANALFQMASRGTPGMSEVRVDVRRDLDGILRNSYNNLKETALKLLLGPMEGFFVKVAATCAAAVGAAGGSQGQLAAGAASTAGGMSSDWLLGMDAGGLKPSAGGRMHPATALGSGSIITSHVELPAEVAQTLAAQSFAKPDRLKMLLAAVLESVKTHSASIRHTMQLYVTSSIARSILLKPIAAEIAIAHRKMDTVLHNCIVPKDTGTSTSTSTSTSRIEAQASLRLLEEQLHSLVNTLHNELLAAPGTPQAK